MKSKVSLGSRAIALQAIAAVLILAGCGGSSNDDDLLSEDCSQDITTSTDLELEVGINGDISLVPVSNNSLSGCGVPSTLIEPLIASAAFETRFENTEDFDVWNCTGPNGANRHFALLSRDDFGSTLLFRKYGFEFDPTAEDLAASQQLFGWRTPRSVTGDLIQVHTLDGVDRVTENPIESDWTNLQLTDEDNFSFTSSITGSMQCTRTPSTIDIDSSRWDVKCKYRGPISAC